MDKINIKTALRAFNRIREEGVERGGEYHLNGIAAGSDFDGYTITLHDDYVTLSIFFHNKFKLDFVNKRHLDAFVERIENIGKQKANRGQSGLTRFFRTSRLGTIPQGDDHETQSIQQTV